MAVRAWIASRGFLILDDFMLASRAMELDLSVDHLFASVIEPHGYFNEAQERSEQARPRLATIRVIGHNAEGTVAEPADPAQLRPSASASYHSRRAAIAG